jgi:hypothetical protein
MNQSNSRGSLADGVQDNIGAQRIDELRRGNPTIEHSGGKSNFRPPPLCSIFVPPGALR